MREIVIIIWSILIMLSGMFLMWSLKKTNRKMGKWTMIHKLVLAILSFGFGYLFYYLFQESNHINWVIRLLVLTLGGLNLYAMYRQNWTLRDKFDYDNDGFLPELIFTFISALVCSIAIASAPQVFGLIAYKVDVSKMLWDLPFVFMLPYLVFKLIDLSSQIPFRTVENPMVYPQEPINAQDWPWRNLMQVNFEVQQSLRKENNLFSRAASPWIEAPKEIALGKIFCLVMQERRKRSQLTTIQDLGTEYDGDPQFWWLFSLKVIWYKPNTWFRKPRYLNPDLTIMANKIEEGDIIIAKRLSGDGSKNINTNYEQDVDFDPEKTTILRN